MVQSAGVGVEAIRWFERLPQGKETREETVASRARMAKMGFELIAKECRQELCRLSITYLNWNNRRPVKDSAKIRPASWSFTRIAPDGRVEGHLFVVTPNKS